MKIYALEIFPLKMEICSLSKSEEDEDENGWTRSDDDFFMMIFFLVENLYFE